MDASVGTGGSPAAPRPPAGSVTVGRYSLKLGAPRGTAVVDAKGEERDEERTLRRALKKDKATAPKPGDEALAAAPELVDKASDITSKVERAVTLFTELAEGRLDPKALSDEVGALVDLLQRLDREGRWSEALSLARALAGLLALLMRWVDLVASLQVAVRAAAKLGDLDAAGWATHELGTLHLGAGSASGAERRLGEAREIRRRIGDRDGLAVTEQNLQALCRLLRSLLREGRLVQRDTRLQRLQHSPALAVGLVAAVIAGGAVAGAAVKGSGGSSSGSGGGVTTAQTTTSGSTVGGDGGGGGTNETTDHTNGGGGGTNGGGTNGGGGGTNGGGGGTADHTAPHPTLTEPTNGSFIRDATPTFSGTAGVDPGDLRTVTIAIYSGTTIGGAPIETATATRVGGSYSAAAPSPLADGVFSAQAQQSDEQNHSGASSAVTFTVDLTSPGVKISRPANGSSLSPPVTFSGTAGHEASDVPTVTIDISGRPFYSSSQTTTTDSSAPSCDSQSFTANVRPGGTWFGHPSPELAEPCTYTAVATQTDEAGNQGRSQVSFTTGPG
jgi:hypothetical protein